MTKYSKVILLSILSMFISINSVLQAQSRVINVPQGIGTLNDAISGDTTSTGERIEPENTVYVLERDGYYLTNGTISNDGWPLRIKAADGTGARPIIMPAVIEGGESAYPFKPEGDFYATGLYITNMDQGNALLSRIFRTGADGIRLVIDDCHLDYASQAALRIDNEELKIYITNSIISNIGEMSSPDNGRAIDDRGNDIDTLVLRNNTFYNITMTVLRDGGGIINYCKVDQNTLLNIAQYGFHFGEAAEAYFTNNLVINAGFIGKSDERGIVDVEPLLIDSSNSGDQQIIVFENNNFYLDQALINALPDTVSRVPNFDSTTTALLAQFSTGKNHIEESIQFTESPTLPTDVITIYYDNSVASVDKKNMDDGGGGPDMGVVAVQSPFDFKYANTFQSYTASTAGAQLGSLTWFGILVGVPNEFEEIPETYNLSQNYPNPFNPETQIQYIIPKENHVRLTIYNSVGQEIRTLVNDFQAAGSHKITWNGVNNFGQKVTSGIYFYRLVAGEFVNIKKMILLK